MFNHTLIHRIFRIKTELQEIYLNQIIQAFALSMIGIFIPMYLLIIGFPFEKVILFMCFLWGSVALFSPFSSTIASRIGMKHSILYRIPIFILAYGFLVLLNVPELGLQWLLYPTAVILGLEASLYWNSLNAEFVKSSGKRNAGKEIGNLLGLPKLATILGPVIGAVILDTLGFNSLFVIIVLIVVVSVFPLFNTGEIKTSSFRFDFRQTKFFANKWFMFVLFLEGIILMSEHFLWPVFIFMKLEDLIYVGISSSLIGVGTGIFIILVGRITDKTDKVKILKVGGFAYSIVWFSRIFSTTPLEMFLLSFLGGMFSSIVLIIVFAEFCDHAKRKNIMSLITFREIWLNIGRVTPLVIILLAFDSSIEVGFLIAGIASLAYVFS